MPRDSQGNYTLPPGTLVATGDTILVSQHNPFAADVQQAISNSLDRNGTGGMRASLPMGGNRIVNVAPGIDPGDVATVAQIAGGGAPIGAIMDFAGATAPSGWMLCGGQSLSRTDFADLFAVLGTTYGSTSAVTFNLPDLRGRVSAGADFSNGGLASRLTLIGSDRGAAGGTQSVTLSTDQMPTHTHDVSGSTNAAGLHNHSVETATSGPGGGGGGGFGVEPGYGSTSDAGSHSHTISVSAANAGGGQAHSNVQPTLILNKIIRTGVN